MRVVAYFSPFQWSDPTTWPIDSTSHVFLARGLDQIGRAKFGDKWVGDEAAVGIAFKQAPWRFVGLSEGPEKYDRFAQVTRDIVKAAEGGGLLTALREELGGENPRPLKAEIWNTEHYGEWFERCSMEQVTVDLFIGRSNRRRYWIFVDRQSLEAFVANLNAVKPTPSKTHVGGKKKFSEWLETEIWASPRTRTLTKKQIFLKGAEFSLSKRHADQLRFEIIANFPEEVQGVWRGAGRPRTNAAAS